MSILTRPTRRALVGVTRGSVRRVAMPVAVLWGLCSIGFGIAIGVRAPQPQLAARLYAASSAAALLAIGVARLSVLGRSGTGPRFDDLLRPPSDDQDPLPGGVRWLEQCLRFAQSSAGDLHARLRPVLREIAGHRLALRSLRLDDPARQDQVAAVLGPVAFELLRRDRPAPDERFAKGASQESLDATIAAIENLR